VRHAGRVDAHHAQGARRIAAQHQARVDAFRGQRLHQPFARRVAREAGEQRRAASQPRQPHRHIEGRAADARVQVQAGGRRPQRVDIHQGFAADHEHVIHLEAQRAGEARRKAP
jgi:hypothetical protein